jgi:hypothetical protein
MHGLSPSDAESSRTSYFAGFGAIIHGFPRLDALFSRTPKRDLARRELFPRFGELAKRKGQAMTQESEWEMSSKRFFF